MNSSDEATIAKIISQYFSPRDTQLSDETVCEVLAQELIRSYHNQTCIVTLTAAPASGKQVFSEALMQKLRDLGHSIDAIDTDDFVKYTREERYGRLAEGMPVIDKYAFDYLNKIVQYAREGKTIQAPIYNEATGEAFAIGEDKFPHTIPAGLHFLLVTGDFQPVPDPDLRIYLHVPTDIRRANRVERDLQKRGVSDAEGIKKSFDERLATQYYPYTLPQAEKADILLVVTPKQPEKGSSYRVKYEYSTYVRKQDMLA